MNRKLFSRILMIACLLQGSTAMASNSLVELSAQNREAMALEVLGNGADANELHSDGTSPLMYASHFGLVSLAEALLEAGADPDLRNNYGSTALAEAAISDNTPIIAMLLKAGADANLANHEGETPLMLTARSGNTEATRLLLEAGADVNAREQWGGQTALMWASAQKQTGTMQLLIQHDADVNLQGYPRLWDRRITSEPRPKDMNKGGFSALQYAARQGCVECIELLAAAGADLNATDPDRVSALNMAILNFHFDVAAELITAGADVNQWDLFGRTSLYNAIDLNTVPSGGRTDIPSEDMRTGYDIAVMLLEHGANPNAQLKLAPPFRNAVFDRGSDKVLFTGATPLLVAARIGDTASVKLLLENGALADLPNAYGQTPLMISAGVDYTSSPTRGQWRTEEQGIEVIRLLMEAGADINALSGDPTLRPGGNDIERTDRNRQMHNANRGPDVIEGKNALHGAARNGWLKVAQYLIDHGIRQQVTDASGRTPLDYAQANYSPAYNDSAPLPIEPMIELLTKACNANDNCVLENNSL